MAKENKEASTLDVNAVFTIITKKSKHTEEGAEIEVSGDIANILIDKGIAKLKN